MKYVDLNRLGDKITIDNDNLIISSKLNNLKSLSERSLLIIGKVIVPYEYDELTNSYIVRNFKFIIKNVGPIKVGLFDFGRKIFIENINSSAIMSTDPFIDSVRFRVNTIRETMLMCFGGSLYYSNSFNGDVFTYSSGGGTIDGQVVNTTIKSAYLKLKRSSFIEKVAHGRSFIRYPLDNYDYSSDDFIKAMLDMRNSFIISIDGYSFFDVNEKLQGNIPGSISHIGDDVSPALVDSMGFPVPYTTYRNRAKSFIIPYEDVETVRFSAFDDSALSEESLTTTPPTDHEYSVYKLNIS